MQVHLWVFVAAGQLNSLLLCTFEVLVFSRLTFLSTNGPTGSLILNIWWHFVPASKMVYSEHFSVIHSQSTVNKCMTEKTGNCSCLIVIWSRGIIARCMTSQNGNQTHNHLSVHLCNWSKCSWNVLGLTRRHLMPVSAVIVQRKRARLNENRLLFIALSVKPSLVIILQP